MPREYRRAIVRLIVDTSGVPGFLFIRGKSRKAAQLLMEYLKHRGSLSREDMGQFARALQLGKVEDGFQYNYSGFYRCVLNRLIQGNCIQVLEGLDDDSIDCAVTDPP